MKQHFRNITVVKNDDLIFLVQTEIFLVQNPSSTLQEPENTANAGGGSLLGSLLLPALCRLLLEALNWVLGW